MQTQAGAYFFTKREYLFFFVPLFSLYCTFVTRRRWGANSILYVVWASNLQNLFCGEWLLITSASSLTEPSFAPPPKKFCICTVCYYASLCMDEECIRFQWCKITCHVWVDGLWVTWNLLAQEKDVFGIWCESYRIFLSSIGCVSLVNWTDFIWDEGKYVDMTGKIV